MAPSRRGRRAPDGSGNAPSKIEQLGGRLVLVSTATPASVQERRPGPGRRGQFRRPSASSGGGPAAPGELVSLAHVLDDDQLEAVVMFANKAASLWDAISDEASRGDLEAIGADLRRARILTLATVLTVKGLEP